ncbi:hypothetical protein za3_16 [Zamilon virus]|nr:hypothetical protein za3_16 [Zamilon virus]
MSNKEEINNIISQILVKLPEDCKQKLQSCINTLYQEIDQTNKNKNDLRVSLQTSMNDNNIMFHRQLNEIKSENNDLKRELNEVSKENEKLKKENESQTQIYMRKIYELHNMNEMYKQMLDLQNQMSELKKISNITEKQYKYLENEYPTFFVKKNQVLVSEDEEDESD